MARGFLSGAILGLAVSVGGAIGLSLLTGGPVMRDSKPEATALDVPAGSEFNQSRDDQQASLPESEPVQAPATTPKVEAPTPDDVANLQETNPATQPETGDVQGGLNAPDAVSSAAPEVSVAGDAPVNPGAQTTAPQAPVAEPQLSVSTEPAQPQPPAADVTEPAVDTAENSMATQTGQSDAPAQEQTEDADVAEEQEAADTDETTDTDLVIRVEPEADAAPAPQPESGAIAKLPQTNQPEPADEAVEKEAESEPQPVIRAESEPGPTPLPDEDAGEDEQVAAISIGKPASNLKTLGTGVQTGRLPSVAAPAAQTQPEEGGEPAQPGAAAASDLPPIKRFAAPFEPNGENPMMAIVLIDDGKGLAGIDALASFPYPLSFAVDTSRDDASEKMAAYRAAGFEVLAMVALPEGAQPQDVETAMPVLMGKVPEAVGVMEAPEDGIQFDRKVSDQVARILADSGHGLLLFSKGLNTAQKLAAKNGVPSATIFRDIDGKAQNANAVRRFLSYGALNAGNEGGVVLVGRLRPDTVTALLLWGLEDRKRQITLAPVSQLLRVQP